MKKYLLLIIALLGLMAATTLSSCKKDSDSDICGTWYGTHTYNNPVGGTKYQYLDITFNANGTGELEYESPNSYSIAYFTYKVSGSTVKCQGAYASTSSGYDDNFSMNLRIDGNRLIPTDLYTQFVLTRDNSVMTDGNGNEIIR